MTEAQLAAEQVQRDRVTDIYNDLNQRVTNEAALKGDLTASFPFQKYGTLQGVLVSVSPDAEDKSSASRDPDTRSGAGAPGDPSRGAAENSNAGYVYKVHIRTNRSQFTVGGESRPVQSGMTVQADITTDRRRVIEFFLSPVVKYLDEGLKVR